MNLTFAVYVTACSSWRNRMELLNRTVSSFDRHASYPMVHKFIVDDCPPEGSTAATHHHLFGWPVIHGALPQSKWREARIVANHRVAARHLDELDPQGTAVDFVIFLEDDWVAYRRGFEDSAARVLTEGATALWAPEASKSCARVPGHEKHELSAVILTHTNLPLKQHHLGLIPCRGPDPLVRRA